MIIEFWDGSDTKRVSNSDPLPVAATLAGDVSLEPGSEVGLVDGAEVTSESKVYTSVTTGEKAPATGPAASQFPTVAAKLVRIKARSANTGKVVIGANTNVVLPDGSTGTVEGFELAAGDDTGWIPVDNLNRFWINGTAATDSVTYMVLA